MDRSRGAASPRLSGSEQDLDKFRSQVSEFNMGITTELMTFTVRSGKEVRAEEWMSILQSRRAECIATLDREHMHHECIFKSFRDGRMRLSWFELRGIKGAHVRTSSNDVDELHMAFWGECIDPDVPPETFEHVLSLMPVEVQRAVDERETSLLRSDL